MTKSTGETTLGTDPWQGAEETLFDRTDWEERAQTLAERLSGVDNLLADLVKRATGAEDEKRRLKAVIERLQSRVYALEDELKTERQRAAAAKGRLSTLKEEILSWKQNEPSPST